MADGATLVPPLFYVVSAFLFGGIIGSFVNAVIYRLPRGISLVTRTRSFCPHCQTQILWYDNIPILSYVLLRGRCRACKGPISARYLVVEILVASLFALSAYQYFALNRAGGPMPGALVGVQMLLAADLACLAFIDLDAWYIPIETTWPWILLGLLLAPLLPGLHFSGAVWLGNARADALVDSLQGLVLGAGSLWLVGFLCLVLLHKEGMGLGDVHLLGMVGALLGWRAALATLYLGVFVGIFFFVAVRLWDAVQQRRLGAQWRPRQPVYELPEGEDETPAPDWVMLVFGVLVLAFEGALLAVHGRPRATLDDIYRLLPVGFGAVVGVFLLLAYPVFRRFTARGEWPHGEVRVREDGKKEEVLHGHYLPFGPSLALAALAVAFYYPLLEALAVWSVQEHWPPYRFQMPGLP